MFSNSFQSGFISIFYSIGSNPLNQWDKAVKNGHIRRVIDDEVKSLVLEVSGTNVATTYITCPVKPRASLGIRLPFLVMVVKNMKKYFTFEIQILDDKDMRRRFRVSNFQSSTKVRPFCTTMPIGLSSGWNQIQFNLADFTRRAYGTCYIETVRVQVHANVRIRRLYFSDRLYNEADLPAEYKLFLPVTLQAKKGRTSKEKIVSREKTGSKEKIGAKATKGVGDHDVNEASKEPSGALPSPTDKIPKGSEQSEDASAVDDKATVNATIAETVNVGEGEELIFVKDDEDEGENQQDFGEGNEFGPEQEPLTDDEFVLNEAGAEEVDASEFASGEEENEAPPPSEI